MENAMKSWKKNHYARVAALAPILAAEKAAAAREREYQQWAHEQAVAEARQWARQESVWKAAEAAIAAQEAVATDHRYSPAWWEEVREVVRKAALAAPSALSVGERVDIADERLWYAEEAYRKACREAAALAAMMTRNWYLDGHLYR